MKIIKNILDTMQGSQKLKNIMTKVLIHTKPTINPCPECRQNDNAEAFESMFSYIINYIKKEELPYIEHKAATNLYQIYLADHYTDKIQTLLNRISDKGILNIKHNEVEITANKYEVDGALLTFPDKTRIWAITPKCKCGKDIKFLQNWTVQISLYSDHKEARLFHLRNDLVRVLPPEQKLPAKLNNLWREARKNATGISPTQLERINFPIDILYTWVNDNDPAWEQKKSYYVREAGLDNEVEGNINKPKSAANKSRFRNRNELLFSLRSVYMYAPFVRKIYIITDDQIPDWLDTTHSKVEVIFHKDIFDEDTAYPVFSSRPIEFNLHHINDLTEHFIYLNDDFFFSSPVKETDFFFYNGIAKVFPTKRLLDARDIQDTDRATVASHKNSSAAFQRHLGISPTGKFKHTAYAVRRSACYEAEKIFYEEVKTSKRNRFRSWDDISWSFVLPYYMLCKEYAVPAEIKSQYIDIHNKKLPLNLLKAELDKELTTLCINDTDSNTESPNEEYLKNWMETRFPVEAPWEKTGDKSV